MMFVLNINAQKECLDELLVLLKKDTTKSDTASVDKTIYTNYSIKVTNWDDETVVSNVKIYSKNGMLNMQSEQALVYQDDHEVLVVLPTQQLVFLNETTKQLNNVKYSSAFYEMRYDFFSSSIVEKCEVNGDNKIIYARVNPNPEDESIKIKYFKCTFNLKTQRAVSMTFDYLPEYKLKQYTITYFENKEVDNYKFFPAKSYYFNSKGKPLDKYKNYTFQDNRKNGKQ